MHRVLSFGPDGAFRLDGYEDITDGRRNRNRNRPTEIFLGTKLEEYPTLPRNSGKSLPPDEVDEVVEKLGNLVDLALVRLFDQFRPFMIHNSELRHLRMRLLDPQVRSQPEQKKAYNLIFDGSGVRNVFESHFKRLEKDEDERSSEGQTIPAHLHRQINFCESVMNTLGHHARDFQRLRACRFFSINPELFNWEDNQEDQVVVIQNARTLFQTLSTQAFQLGYAMAIFTVIEELKRLHSTESPFLYPERLTLVEFVTEAYLAALNTYFSPKEERIHRTLNGYIRESRASVFDANSHGLRGLLGMSVKELNERQWRFFRYAILEIIHSPLCWNAALEKMKQTNNKWCLAWYKDSLRRLVDGIISERNKYVEDAMDATVKGNEFELLRERTESEARGAMKSNEEIQHLVDQLKSNRRIEAKKLAHNHLKASLKIVQSKADMLTRLNTGL